MPPIARRLLHWFGAGVISLGLFAGAAQLFGFDVPLGRWIWSMWTGDTVTWRGATIRIERPLYLTPGDYPDIEIGRFDESDEPFPRGDILLLLDSERSKCTEAWVTEAHRRTLRLYSEFDCVTSDATAVVSPVGVSAMECRVSELPGSYHVATCVPGTMGWITFHGSRDNFGDFVPAINSVIQQLAPGEGM